MLFITNRVLNESFESSPGRSVSFNLKNNTASPSVYFCERKGKGKYKELMSKPFMGRLKDSEYKQLLLYIHGYSNLPEEHIFPRAAALQSMLDAEMGKGVILAVPIIWPCDNDLGIIKDYYDDQIAADDSATAFARVIGKFLDWREGNDNLDVPCLMRMNVLAHSMGNRVFRGALHSAAQNFLNGGVPLLFRNVFLVAADVVNETLEKGQPGHFISDSARNVTVYFASDDLALRASKIANVGTVASRRLGHSGPENMEKVATNVYAVDCDEVNTDYDSPKGHSYFLKGTDSKPGKVFQHMCHALRTGRVLMDSPHGRMFEIS